MSNENMSRSEKIDWDSEQNRLVVTKQEYIDIGDAKNIDEAKNNLDMELRKIIQQVKALKQRAERIKEIRSKLEAGLTSPASPYPIVLIPMTNEASQSSSAEIPGPT